MTELSRQAAEKLVESIGIPPRPAVVLAVMKKSREMNRTSPSSARLSPAMSVCPQPC
jgi:hypothetical protein